MHILQLAKRDALARERIARAVGTLSLIFLLDDNISLSVQQKDPRVRAMLEREATADFLEAIIRKMETDSEQTLAPVGAPIFLDPTTVSAETADDNDLPTRAFEGVDGEIYHLAAFSEDGTPEFGVIAESVEAANEETAATELESKEAAPESLADLPAPVVDAPAPKKRRSSKKR